MIFRLLTIFLILGLNACSLDPIFSPGSAAPVPRYPTAAPPTQATRPESPSRQASAKSVPESEIPKPRQVPQPPPPAVVALMQQAESDRSRGDLERAASRLERALRIQPRSAELWYQLAIIRFQQEQPGLAEELAKKSLSLAAGHADLIQRNWALIAKARYQRGDVGGAREAEHRAASPH